MAPRVEVYIEETQEVLASVEVDSATPQNTMHHIGTKLVELVQMGRMRSKDYNKYVLHVSYDGQGLNEPAPQVPSTLPDLYDPPEPLATTLFMLADNPTSGITEEMRQSILSRRN